MKKEASPGPSEAGLPVGREGRKRGASKKKPKRSSAPRCGCSSTPLGGQGGCVGGLRSTMLTPGKFEILN